MVKKVKAAESPTYTRVFQELWSNEKTKDVARYMNTQPSILEKARIIDSYKGEKHNKGVEVLKGSVLAGYNVAVGTGMHHIKKAHATA